MTEITAQSIRRIEDSSILRQIGNTPLLPIRIFEKEFPEVEVYAVEPAGFDDTARSLRHGERVENDPAARSFCDALLSPMPGELTFAIMQTHLSGGLTVTDEQTSEAMRQAFSRLKLVVEPGGAVALAAALSGTIDCENRTTVIVCSGGNADPRLFAEVLRQEA